MKAVIIKPITKKIIENIINRPDILERDMNYSTFKQSEGKNSE